MQANHGLGCEWIPADGAVASVVCDIIGVIHELSVRWAKERRTCILRQMMSLIMRLVATCWVLMVGLEPRCRLLLGSEASLSSLGDIGDVHHALALAGHACTSAAFLSAHHDHRIEVIRMVHMVFWMPVLTILVVNG